MNMKLNCKAGDLAVFVKSTAGNEGKIVLCVRYLGVITLSNQNGHFLAPAWEIDTHVPSWTGKLVNIISDEYLRPIRDQDGEDEMLRIVGRPMEKPRSPVETTK